MNHKCRKPRNAGAGCLLYKPNKPNKMNGWNKGTLGHAGFGKLRAARHATNDLQTDILAVQHLGR